MNRSIASVAGLAALAFLLSAAAARTDEIKLKDGSKINGTIVGFEDNSFKVKTSYGFAVVQKDQVVSITVTDAAKRPESDERRNRIRTVLRSQTRREEVRTGCSKKPESAAAKHVRAAPAPKPEKIERASALRRRDERRPAKTPEPDSGASADNSVVEYPHVDTPTSSATNSAPPAATSANAAVPLAAAATPRNPPRRNRCAKKLAAISIRTTLMVFGCTNRRRGN